MPSTTLLTAGLLIPVHCTVPYHPLETIATVELESGYDLMYSLAAHVTASRSSLSSVRKSWTAESRT